MFTLYRVSQQVHDTYLLVNIVDNNYVDASADIFRIFHEVRAAVAVVC